MRLNYVRTFLGNRENGVINRKHLNNTEAQTKLTFQVLPLKSVQTDFK